MKIQYFNPERNKVVVKSIKDFIIHPNAPYYPRTGETVPRLLEIMATHNALTAEELHYAMFGTEGVDVEWVYDEAQINVT